MTASTSPAVTATIEAVTFDYWNTLCYEPDLGYLRGLRVEAVLDVLTTDGVEVQREALEAAYDEAWNAFNSAWIENRQFTGIDAAHHCFDQLGDVCGVGTARRDQLVEAFVTASEHCTLSTVDGVEPVLRALRDLGVRVGIICDVGLTASPVLRRRLEERGLLGYFDHWSFSDEVGVYKPDRRIFDHALDGLGGVSAARAAHVGDRRRTDVAGAMAMGMTAVRITTIYDDDNPDEGPSGHVVIDSYADLLPSLGLA